MQKLFLCLAAVSAICLAGQTNAADKPDKAPAEKAPEKRPPTPPFTGKIVAVDQAAKTITVGKRTFHVTDATKVVKDGKPASLADAKVGEEVGGQYRTSEDGKLQVLSLRLGPKQPPGEPSGK